MRTISIEKMVRVDVELSSDNISLDDVMELIIDKVPDLPLKNHLNKIEKYFNERNKDEFDIEMGLLKKLLRIE